MNIDSPEKIAMRLKEERQRIGMSIVSMAEAMQVGRATQTNYEAGVTSPGIDYIHGLAALGVDSVYVITGIKSRDVLICDQPDMLWTSVQATLKLAGKNPHMPCSDAMLGETTLKLYRLLVEQNNNIASCPLPVQINLPTEADY